MGRDQHFWGTPEGEESSCTQRGPLMVGGSSGIERDLRGIGGGVQQSVCGRQDRIGPMHIVCAAALHTPA